MALHPDFLRLPIAHRGLHSPGVPENSMAAFRAAIDAGYGIECDIQATADGQAVVFHDYDLSRLADDAGFVADLHLQRLQEFRLLGSDEQIPTLRQLLEEVAGRVPLLIEIKDQDGRLGPNIGTLQDKVARELQGYQGPVAVMSFNPYTVGAFHEAAPEITAGLTTCGYLPEEWPMLDDEMCDHLAQIADFDSVGAEFISHDHDDLGNPAVLALAARDVPVLCWTIRSPEAEARARRIAQNITFEDYFPEKP